MTMTTLFIIGATLLIASIIASCADRGRAAFLFAVLGAYIISVPMWEYRNRDKPTAMDVYQGKTTLEITYKNGVAVDSVVVFKNKKK